MSLTIVLIITVQVLTAILLLLIAVAYFTIAERKIMAGVQRRKGPNVIGFVGLLQPLADGLKLFVKETTLPSNADQNVFLLSPLAFFTLSLASWSVIPYDHGIVLCDLRLGALYILAISSLSVYGILLSGWASNSKYAYLGAIRSAAQMISYELALSICVLSVATCAGSFNLSEIVLAQKEVWHIFPLFPLYIVFQITMLAETNRHPFDLPEAESELVSGYNVEYSGISFALFFLGEYSNMLLMSAFSAILFLGGWLPPFNSVFFNIVPGSVWFALKILIGVFIFIMARASLPRYRYDQLMQLGWKSLLPLSLSYYGFIVVALKCLNYAPVTP